MSRHARASYATDAPYHEPVDGDDWVTVEDSAEMWLMFKPEGEHAEWVPLRKVSWWWQGDARKEDGEWHLEWGDNSDNPQSDETTQHPEWDLNVINLDWERD